jgi:hypothetical protein
VCASRAGTEERKNETIGRTYHWSARIMIFWGFVLISSLFRIRISTIVYTMSIELPRVRIRPDIWGRINPMTVRLNTGLMIGVTVANIVRIKNEVGHSR